MLCYLFSTFLLFLLLLPNVCTNGEPSLPIDLIKKLRLSESSQVTEEYGVKFYSLENSTSRPILEIDPTTNLTLIAFRVSIRTNYAKRGTLLAITNRNTSDVFLKMHFSQSLYDLHYMMVDIKIGNQTVTLYIRSFDANTWLNLVFIITEYRVYLYDRTDCLSGDSESISDVEWPNNLANYSLFLGTTGEDGDSVMKGIELSELLLYSGQEPYSHLCQSTDMSPTDPDVIPNGLSGSGDIEMSGSGNNEITTEVPTATPMVEPRGVGAKGEPGEPGRMGPRGPKGDRGDTSVVTQVGLNGEKGDTGAAGAVGGSGGKGDNGEIGGRGEKGEKGEELEWDRIKEEIQSVIGNNTINSSNAQPSCELMRSCMSANTSNSLKGDKGMSGDQGSIGERGRKGETGFNGEKGETGLVGPSGPSGPQGIKGDRCDNGVDGSKGSKGDVGRTGEPGMSVVGRKGESGERGEVGATGLDGVTGSPGPPGPIGIPGPPGVVQYYRGVPGRNGSRGDAGVMGSKGDSGAEGRPGDVGLKGENGRRGSKGDIGEKGRSGIGEKGIKGAKGDPAHMNITDEYLKSAVSRIPELVSLKGERGDQGTTGPNGELGRQGFPGIPGTAGPKGEPATAPTGTGIIHARTRQEMAAVNEAGALVYRSDLEKMAFLSLDGWLEIRASVTPWVEIVDVGETASTSQPDGLCGNGVLDGDEECDSTNFNELTCKLLRGDLYEGELRCTSHCTLDLSLCQLSSIVLFGLTTPVSGRLDGITGADRLCNRESDAGHYKAYIYSFNRNPATLVPYRYHYLPVKNTQAENMYDSWAELLRGNMLEESLASIKSADGEELTNSGYWIGDRQSNCRNWNSQQATDTAFSTLKNSEGYSQSHLTCNQELSLICVLISF